MTDVELQNQFIFSKRGRELHTFINDNQGQMSANKMIREIFEAGYNVALNPSLESPKREITNTSQTDEDLIMNLRKRAEIRRQISTRKSVQEGAPDRISDLLEAASDRIEEYKTCLASASVTMNPEEVQLFVDKAIKDYKASLVPVAHIDINNRKLEFTSKFDFSNLALCGNYPNVQLYALGEKNEQN